MALNASIRARLRVRSLGFASWPWLWAFTELASCQTVREGKLAACGRQLLIIRRVDSVIRINVRKWRSVLLAVEGNILLNNFVNGMAIALEGMWETIAVDPGSM